MTGKVLEKQGLTDWINVEQERPIMYATKDYSSSSRKALFMA
jgi:hypothetical protein